MLSSNDPFVTIREMKRNGTVKTTRQAIRTIARRIVDEFHPERVILFGSYAYGTPKDNSDVDLLVVLKFRGNELRKAVEIVNRVDPPFPVDLIARTPQKLRQRLAWKDDFMCEIIEKGHILYESSRT